MFSADYDQGGEVPLRAKKRKAETAFQKTSPATWPEHICQAIDGIAIAMMTAYMLVRGRALDHGSPIVRNQAEMDAKDWEIYLLNEEPRLQHQRFSRLAPELRPDFEPEERLRALTLMRLRKWRIREAAERLIVHPNTVRTWLKLLDAGGPHAFWEAIPWNRIGDGVRWLCHHLKQINPALGTRKIAMLVRRAGIAISRASVQRFLREEAPKRPHAPKLLAPEPGAAIHPFHILDPRERNRTWHLDLTCFDFLFVRFCVAGLLDGFTRKILALKVYRDAPASRDMLELLKDAVETFGKPENLVGNTVDAKAQPKFLVTDHGAQFRKRFRAGVKKLGIHPVRGKVHDPKFNGKIEAFFKKLKLWWKIAFLIPNMKAVQMRLDLFRTFTNEHNPLWLHGGRTPDEVWNEVQLPRDVPIRARDPLQPAIEVEKCLHGNDPNLPILAIRVTPFVKLVA